MFEAERLEITDLRLNHARRLRPFVSSRYILEKVIHLGSLPHTTTEVEDEMLDRLLAGEQPIV